MTVYVNNAFSTKMLEKDCTISCQFIDENKFREAILLADEIIIGHEDTAKYFNVNMNRKTIRFKKNDILFVCEANNESGERLPSGTQFLEEMGESFYFRFIKIIIKEE